MGKESTEGKGILDRDSAQIAFSGAVLLHHKLILLKVLNVSCTISLPLVSFLQVKLMTATYLKFFRVKWQNDNNTEVYLRTFKFKSKLKWVLMNWLL